MRNTALLLCVAATLGACTSVPAPKPGTVKNAPPPAASVHGRAFYLERIAMPPGASLEVLLIGERGDTAPVTIAMQTFDDLHGPPYDFTLTYAPTHIGADMRCSLRAALRDAHGHLEFATAAGVPVTPGSAARVELRLVRSSEP